MTSAVFDASAVLALVFAEAGADIIGARLPGSLLSAANYAEVLTKSVDRGRTLDDTVAQGSAGRERTCGKRRIAVELRADLETLRKQYGHFSDSAQLIREDRDERG